MENMLALLEQVEIIALEGGFDFELLSQVYQQLIEDGFLPKEINTADKVEDIFLIDYEYEFLDGEILIALSQLITLFTYVDCEEDTYYKN